MANEDEVAFRAAALNDQPALSSAQVLEMRELSAKAFDAREALQAGGGDAATRTERRAAFLAQFDSAAAADGHGLASPDPAVAAQHQAHGIALDPTPDQYNVVWANPQRVTPAGAQEAKEWAGAMKLSPELGASLLTHLSSVGPQLESFSKTQREQWQHEQTQQLIYHTGSPEAAEALRTRALQALALAGADNKLSKAISSSPASFDWYLVRTLANHLDAYEALNASLPKKVISIRND